MDKILKVISIVVFILIGYHISSLEKVGHDDEATAMIIPLAIVPFLIWKIPEKLTISKENAIYRKNVREQKKEISAEYREQIRNIK